MRKNLIFLGTVFAVSILFWALVKPWLAALTDFSNYGLWLGPLAMLVLLVALEGLIFLLFKKKLLKILAVVLAGLPLFLFFGLNRFYVGAFALMFLLQLSAIQKIKEETAERTKVNVKVIARRGLPAIVTSVLILVSFAYFLSPATQAIAQKQELPAAFRKIVEQTVTIFAGENLEQLPPSVRDNVISQATGEVMKKLTDSLQPYFKFLPPILAFGLFLFLQGLSIIFVWLGVAVSILLFWLFKKAGLIKINTVKKEAEELEF